MESYVVVTSVTEYAWRSIRRHRDKSIFTIIGLSLAIASMVFVYTMAVAFQSDVHDILRYEIGANTDVWIVPKQGFHFDGQHRVILVNGTLGQDLFEKLSTAIDPKTGAKAVHATAQLVSIADEAGGTFVVMGSSDLPGDGAIISSKAAQKLGIKKGDSLSFRGVTMRVEEVVEAPIPLLIKMPLVLAQKLMGESGRVSWIAIDAPNPRALVLYFRDRFGLIASSDPIMKNLEAAPFVTGIAYLMSGGFYRFDVYGFDFKFSQLLLTQVVSTAFGSLAKITLGLGFILVVSTSIITLEERRKEMGILTSIGVITDIIYEFLAETVILFAISLGIGTGIGIVALYLVLPQLASLRNVFEALIVIAMFFPPMIVFGALVPANTVLNKKPAQLMRSD